MPVHAHTLHQMSHCGVTGDDEPTEEVADWEAFLLPHANDLHNHTKPRAFLFRKDDAGDVIMEAKSAPLSKEPWGTAQNGDIVKMFPGGAPADISELRRVPPCKPADWNSIVSSCLIASEFSQDERAYPY